MKLPNLAKTQMILWIILLAIIVVLMYVWVRPGSGGAARGCGPCEAKKNVQPVE